MQSNDASKTKAIYTQIEDRLRSKIRQQEWPTGSMLPSRRDLAREYGVSSLTIDRAVTRLIAVNHSDGFILYRITLRNSPNFHVAVTQTSGFTAWGVKIATPRTARNTDGIDPSSSTNVTIRNCYIATGDDNVAIKSGPAGPSANITVADNHFYSGHGMSIGSNTNGGVNHVQVTNLSLQGTDNGIRIKSDRSRGGLVEDVTYEGICMRDVANPIVLNSQYTIFPGNQLPVYRNITLKQVRSVTPGFTTVVGVDDEHPVQATFESVAIDGQKPGQVTMQHANVKTSGSDVLSCANRFPPYPKLPPAPVAAVKVPEDDHVLYVAADGTGDFYSIQRAIDVAPDSGAVISIAPGEYREVLTIAKPHITLRSPYTDATKTVIVFDKSAGTSGGTTNSTTVNVLEDDFTAENLTFQNDGNKNHPQTQQGSQALALRVTGDRETFRNVRFLGNQDTLYAANKRCDKEKASDCLSSRQYFVDCYIEGNVDFIFGDAKAYFERCEIKSNRPQGGYITAQSKRDPDQDSVYVFDNCKLTSYPGVSHVWLGRPWRAYAAVVFLNTQMDASIEPAGWREWHPGETHSLDTAFYAEYNSSGPGAHPGQRDPHGKKLTQSQASAYDKAKFFKGWLPK